MRDGIETKSSKVYALHVAGYPNYEIAQKLGISMMETVAYLNDERKRISQYVTDDERAARLSIEANRLDTLQSAYWESAMMGNTKDAEFVLKIIDRRSKLFGLDKPTDQGDVTRAILIAGGTKEEFMQILSAAQEQRAVGADIVDAEVIEEDE